MYILIYTYIPPPPTVKKDSGRNEGFSANLCRKTKISIHTKNKECKTKL